MSTRFLVALLVAFLLPACESAEERIREARELADAEVEGMAEGVIEAWTSRDGSRLAEYVDPEIAETMMRRLDRAEVDGHITSFSVSSEVPELVEAEEVNDKVEVSYDAPFTVTWVSEAAAESLELDGSFQLQYSSDTEGWSFDGLSPSSLWPGVDRARGFTVEYRWLKRGAIKDRDGRVFASGRAEERTYPFGSLAGSVIGHIGTVTEADVEDGADAEIGDLIGASGIEAAFQGRLAGLPDSELRIVDKRGRTLEIAGGIEGTPGENVKVTLDVDVQQAAENAYGRTIGGAVVMQPATGDLLAIVDSSSFDPNNYVGSTDVQPFNRALSGGYPPGSAMKVVTAAAALDTRTVTPETPVTGPKEYKGVRNFESGKFGTIPFATALKFSVNTAFAQIAEDLGAEKLTRYAEAFGFNQELEMPLETRESSFPFPADLGDLMWSSVGQAQVLATPLQMASVAATVANRGQRMEPRIDLHDDPQGSRVMKVATADTLAALMQTVVEGGTGVGARISGVSVAGKTGTAEVDVAGERKNHAWFICFSPVADSRVAVAVVSEYGGIGGEVAAPLARAILQSVLPLVP